MAFTYSLDKKGDFTVKSLADGSDSANITVHSDGTADVKLNNNAITEKYNLKIENLNKDEIDIDVYKGKNKVDSFDSFEQLNYDKYEAQGGTGSFYVFSLSLLVEVLLTIALVAVVASVTYYSIVSIIEKIKAIAEKQIEVPIYYRAIIAGPQVLINFFNPMTQHDATDVLKSNGSVYTYFSSAASYAVRQVGEGIVGPEIDTNRKAGYIYYYHFHIDRDKHKLAHAFFGFPYTL